MADWKITLKKVLINLAIYGLPAMLVYGKDHSIAWIIGISGLINAIIDIAKHYND